MGVASQNAVATFNGLRRPLPVIDGIVPTELFPLRSEVEAANKLRLDALRTELQIYESCDTGSATGDHRATFLKNMVAQHVLEIKADTQVMLIKNVDENLVNGCIGKVLGFYLVSEVCGSGGDISPKGGNGFIRRVLLEDDRRTLMKWRVAERENENSVMRPKSKSGPLSSAEKFPLVEFRTSSGKEVMLVGRDEFKVEEPDGTVAARRVQVSDSSSIEHMLKMQCRSHWSLLGQFQYIRAKAKCSSTLRWTSPKFLKMVRSLSWALLHRKGLNLDCKAKATWLCLGHPH